MFTFLKRIFGTAQDRILSRYARIVKEVNQWEKKYQPLSDDALKEKTNEFRQRLKKGETVDQLLPEAYAVVKLACARHRGTEVHVSGYNQRWDMVPYDVQVLGGIAMHHGAIAEMQTGEGKTLTALMPLYLNALTGDPVHLVTVNDYLAERDCEWVGTILRWLGITTGTLTGKTPMEDRKSIYLADVVYGTASEFGFDYLRDNSMAFRKEDQSQRGYYFAIIDEVDSILIDEARTPLIISGPSAVSKQMYDELKQGVADLVRRQRDLCNRYASEARKVIEKYHPEEEQEQPVQRKERDKKQEAEEAEAMRKLWLVHKGTPQNKILKRLKENPDIRVALDNLDLSYHAEQNKEDKARVLADLFIIVDEKSNEFELTDKGITAWQDCTDGVGQSDDFVMLDLSHEFLEIDADTTLDTDAKVKKKLAVQEEDAKRKERAHNLRQLLRGHLLMERDVDYIVQEGKIIIIDEHTGRAQPGRRFSDGLHQAIEAKEGVAIQKETQTYATITLQNYFRMYKKISGMTGTASTEANEFKEIYKLDVLAIPTYRPNQRKDNNDEIYMTEREKYNAILKEVRDINAQGRPILIGTETVEVSEKLSRIFRQNKLEHTVLNAKQNDKEAEIVANAGQRAAITIATNMAGRGTDIKLGAGIADLGGLHVIGTTRHQSRRIDRQLRGRCARLGDPGSSKFYISFEDSLLRLFASPRLTTMIQRFRPEEGEAISAGILNRSISTAQKRVEQRNYTIRKHTLEYDDVMNKQRKEVYAFRNDILHLEDATAIAFEVLQSVIGIIAEQFFKSRGEEGGWDAEGFRQQLIQYFPVTFEEGYFDNDISEREELEAMAYERILEALKKKLAHENAKVPRPDDNKSDKWNPAGEAVRNLMLRKTDMLWQEHLLGMDHLRIDVSMRSVGQKDPLMEFKHEAFALFDEFSRRLRTDIAHDLFRFEFVTRESMLTQQILNKMQFETDRSFMPEGSGQIEEDGQERGRDRPMPSGGIARALPEGIQSARGSIGQTVARPVAVAEPVVASIKIGRNEVCACGSGKKYKKCCGAGDIEE